MRTITIKGTGKVSIKPDMISVKVTLKSDDMDYTKTIKKADQMLESLRKDSEAAGLQHDDIKTLSYNVNPQFNNISDQYNNYKKVFTGYLCSHELKIEFGFDMNKLSTVLTFLAASDSKPEFSVNFTVRDKQSLTASLLKNAAENAKKNAEILCKASGVTLGNIVSIDYDWGELNIYSRSSYNIDRCITAESCMSEIEADIVPDDIDLSDTVTFVWELI